MPIIQNNKMTTAKQMIKKQKLESDSINNISTRQKDKYIHSDDDNDEELELDSDEEDIASNDEEDIDSNDEEDIASNDEEEINTDFCRKAVAKLFPSKYINKRINDIKKSEIRVKNAIKHEICDKNAIKCGDNDKSSKKSYRRKDTKNKMFSEKDIKQAKKQFNIIFTTISNRVKRKDDEEYGSEDDCEEDDEYESEDDSEEYDESDDSEESYDSEEEEEDDSEEGSDSDDDEYTCRSKKEPPLNEQEMDTNFTILKTQMNKMIAADPENKVFKKCLEDLTSREKSERKKLKTVQKKDRSKNTKQFRKLVKNRESMSDAKYFNEKLSVEEQMGVLKEMEAVNKLSNTEKPYRLTILDSNIPMQLKSIALCKISSLRYMEPGQGEYYKVKNWIDTFMKIPFNKYKQLPITYDAGIEKCQEFIENAKTILDTAVYGMNDAKQQIMQLVGQWITNPNAIGTAIAIKGPMGTGKTTLIKEGISKILGRDFAFISLGGATDSSFLEGHSYTYEGSTWGKIVDIIIKSKSMNPVIYFDELDKISDTPKGDEIAGILTHLTDTSQNSMYHDKYFSEIDFDVSKCLFIFSYNDESKVNPILLDRMYKIQTKGYEKKDKLVISNDYLIPNILSQINFKHDDISFSTDTISYIVDNYTAGECGVRNLKRCLEYVCTKLNLYRLMKPGSKLFEDETSIEVTFPYSVSVDVARKIIKTPKSHTAFLNSIYI